MKKQKTSTEELTFNMNEDWVFENQNVNLCKGSPAVDALIIINRRFHFEFDVVLGTDNTLLDPDTPLNECGYSAISFKNSAFSPHKVIKLTKPLLRNILRTSDILDRIDELWSLVDGFYHLVTNGKNCIDKGKIIEKKDFKIRVCGGATGIGKTKLLYELRSIFSNKKHFEDVKPIFLTFNSETPYTKAEDTFTMEQAVNARIACVLGQYTGADALRSA
eukprot:NODE_858_length_3653_cov_0.483118.p2 type:complete len:219 gc:universal NODE_858_length_3653_cov_0.483118:1120-1776(+)